MYKKIIWILGITVVILGYFIYSNWHNTQQLRTSIDRDYRSEMIQMHTVLTNKDLASPDKHLLMLQHASQLQALSGFTTYGKKSGLVKSYSNTLVLFLLNTDESDFRENADRTERLAGLINQLSDDPLNDKLSNQLMELITNWK